MEVAAAPHLMLCCSQRNEIQISKMARTLAGDIKHRFTFHIRLHFDYQTIIRPDCDHIQEEARPQSGL
jgi:hypothetical protein